MPEFRCRVATANGEVMLRDYEAESADILRRDLERQDFLVLDIERRSALLAAFGDLFKRRRKVSQKEFLLFNQEFAALIRAGIPITESITMLSERRENPDFRAALEDVRDRIRGGESISDAFAAQGLFPNIYSSTLASGERSGEIATVLQRYTAFAHTMMTIRQKVVSALVYPAVLLVLAAIVIGILLFYVLPKFQEQFVSSGVPLPMITEVVVGASETVRQNWIIALVLVVGVPLFLLAWGRTAQGARALEALRYKLPGVGRVSRSFVITRFSRTLSTLLSGGIPVVSSLEVLGRSIGTPIYADATHEVEQKIREGAALWSSLEETRLFPDTFIGMVKIGESSGSLPEMLGHVADFVDQEIEHDLQRFTALIEPALLGFMAVVVGTIVIAMFVPLIRLSSAAGGF